MRQFTPFWVSTPRAQQRTAHQGYHEHHKQQREKFYDPDRYIQVPLPQGRFVSVRRQIKAVQKAIDYKLRKSELQALNRFLTRNSGLHALVLPKQRNENRLINFDDAKLKWVEKGN